MKRKLMDWQKAHIANVAIFAYNETKAKRITDKTENPYKIGDWWNSTFQSELVKAWEEGKDLGLQFLARE